MHGHACNRRLDMGRPILDDEHIHPAIRNGIDQYHADIVAEVQAAIASHDVVVVGMKQNPFPRRARALLDRKGIAYEYLEYGSYASMWRRRLALKMWSGWPTLPMIFIKGVLIGGTSDLQALDQSGELDRLLG
jgi:monothiol glutaredoxin